MFKQVIACLLISPISFATEVAPVSESFVDKISICDSLTLVNYKNEPLPNGGTTLFLFDQGIQFKINNNFTATIDIPVYFVNSTTTLGAVELDLIWDAWKNDNLAVRLSLGVNTPMNTSFGASSVDPNLGGVVTYDLPWGGSQFVQTVNYEFVTGNAYSLPFGSKVSDDVLITQSTILCPVGDNLQLGMNVWQNYTVVTDGQQNILVGPNAGWSITNNVSLDLSVAMPVYQNVSESAEQNYTVSAGLGIKF